MPNASGIANTHWVLLGLRNVVSRKLQNQKHQQSSNFKSTWCTSTENTHKKCLPFNSTGKRQKAVYRLVTAPQGGTPWLLPTIMHADRSNRPRTAFRRWTQAVHQVAAIHVGRHRFLACPYRLLVAKRQAKAGLSPRGHSHYRTAFESFAPEHSRRCATDVSENQIHILQTS